MGPATSSTPHTSTGAVQLDLDGVYNFRDLGGLGVGSAVIRTGLLFRSDGLHRADELGREAILNAGIRRVIDLRTDGERTDDGSFEQAGIAYHHVPVVESLADLLSSTEGTDDLLRQHYRYMVRSNGQALAKALRLITTSVDAGEPVVFHCTAGKDRTGVLAGLILSGLGCDDRTIAADYARSAAAMPHMIAWYQRNERQTPDERMKEMGVDPSLANQLIGATEPSMLGLLDDVRTDHGSVRSYLDSIGVEDALQRLAHRLLDPRPTPDGGSATAKTRSTT